MSSFSVKKFLYSLGSALVLNLGFLNLALADPRNVETNGGMWMPEQISFHEALLKKMGLNIQAKDLSELDSKVLSSIVSLEFCSGSFISPDGLIITNHHCVEAILSYMSQVDREKGIEADYVTTGFLAKNFHEERPAPESQKILITQKIIDVTEEVLKDIASFKNAGERAKEIEKRTNAITKRTEADGNGIRADVVSFFRGEKYFLIEKLELKDVRLVYAPPKGVGFFGGDTDNWHWPRHTGDFGILRAYVGTNQKPRAYDINNVPYRNAHHLTVSSRGVNPYDLIFVAGFPGMTNRLLTTHEVKSQFENAIPELITTYNEMIALLTKLGATDENIRIKTESRIFSLSNTSKNKENALLALKKINYISLKENEEAELLTWVSQQQGMSPNFIAEIESINKEFAWLAESSVAVGRLTQFVDLVGSASTIARLAYEKTKPDLERLPAYMERNWQRFIEQEKTTQKKHSPLVTKELFVFFLKKIAALPERNRPLFFSKYFIDGAVNEVAVNLAIDKTPLANLDERIRLLNSATLEELETSTDPLIQLGVAISAFNRVTEKSIYERSGKLALVLPKYIEALRAFKKSKGEELAPDANSTLRVTFGQVKGYTAQRGEKIYHFGPFSNAEQMMEKHKVGDPEFEIPVDVQRAIVQGNFQPFADDFYGTLPVNFLAGVDTTGGNSGSAAMNAKGELVGLLFDGNEDALYSDWHYNDSSLQNKSQIVSPVRSILLDIRYALWLLKEVAGANHLLREMNLNPPCDLLLSK